MNAYNLERAGSGAAPSRPRTSKLRAAASSAGPTEIGVRTMGRVEHVEEFSDIIVKNVGGAPIRLRDVGYVEDGMAEKRSFAYLQGPAGRDARSPPPDRHQYRQSGRRRHGATCEVEQSASPPGVKIDSRQGAGHIYQSRWQRSKNTWCSAACWPRSSSGSSSAIGAWF